MSLKRAGLGRNLSALLGQNGASFIAEQSSVNVSAEPMLHTRPIANLQPGKYQPRGDFDDTALTELADSIKKQGLIQPVVVREISENRYEIIAGERRWRACQLIGMTDIPVVIRQVDDETAMALALIENLQREDLNAMDQARAMQRLIEEFGLTHQQIAELLSKSRTAVSNYLRLLNLAPDVRRMLEYGDLDMGHARCLLMLDDSQQMEVAQLVVAKGLSVRETEALVARVKAGKLSSSDKNKAEPLVLFTDQLDMLSKHLEARVKLKHGKAGKGVLMIHYDDLTSLEKMITRFKEK
ncbi:MAG: ParB/RepB/Spo0J family partition protein [Legionellaceae bacterium]|nr:ParB/RepB/Spo0J family partition protein [Legionellaceae bacterium]